MKKKLALSKNDIITMLGIIICLITLIIIFSYKTPLAFLSTAILGAIGFVGFWVLIPLIFLFGLYLIFRRKIRRFKISISLWGLFIIVLAAMILVSLWVSNGQVVQNKLAEGQPYVVLTVFASGTNPDGLPYEILRFNNSIDFMEQIVVKFAVKHGLGNKLNDGFTINNTLLGGGYIGYILCGLLNSGITTLGTVIVSWVIAFLGLLMVFNRQIKRLFSKKKHKVRKEPEITIDDIAEPVKAPDERTFVDISRPENKVEFTNNESMLEEVEDDDSFFEKEELNDLSMRNFNNTHGLTKPIFKGDDEDDDQQTLPDYGQVLNNPTPFINNEPVIEENDLQAQVNDNDFVEQPKESVDEESIHEDISPIETSPTIEEVKPLVNNVQIQKPAPEVIVDLAHRPQPKATIKPIFKLPPLSLLKYHEDPESIHQNDRSCQERIDIINKLFTDMNVGAEVIDKTIGPSVTRYDVRTNASVSVNAIKKVVEDLAIRLGGIPVRFEPIVLGKTTSGIEIPNEIRTNVGLREAMEAMPQGEKYQYGIPFGKNISGDLIHANITDFPHMLVGGTSGSGKSIFIHSVLLALIMRNNPYQLKLMLIDPKMVEMRYYEDIPQLLCPVIYDPRKAYVGLKKLCDEMQRRYNLFGQNRVRDIKEFNRMAKEKGIEPLPYIVVCVDEYADLNDEVKEIREPVVRIVQKARSAGIHMIIATQRPSVDVIDGVIKANLNTHVALLVGNFVDSKVILDEGGAEKLLGNGDMIVDSIVISRFNKPRVQGCFVESSEISAVTDYLRSVSPPLYDPEFLDLSEPVEEEVIDTEISIDTASLKEASDEQLYEQIKKDLVGKQYFSISLITRTYGVGFPRAGRMFSRLQKEGYVAMTGDARGSKVLMKTEQSESPTSIAESKVYYDDSSED